MCKKHSFWDLRTRIRRNISLKNKNILIVETVQEEYDVEEVEALEMLMESDTLYSETEQKLKEYYKDI